jgi:hypothetical protein
MKRPPLGLAFVVVPVVVLIVLHLAGARAHLGVLSGTRVAVEDALLALVYALAWFGAIITAPIIVLARALRAGAAAVHNLWVR